MPEPIPNDPGMPPAAGEQPVDQQDGEDTQQDATDYKAEARKWEQRAKQNIADAKRAKQLEAELNLYREQNQSETEKAINAARR